jgi:hypothetical protein
MKELFNRLNYNEIKIKVFDCDRSVFKITDKPENAMLKLKEYLKQKYG